VPHSIDAQIVVDVDLSILGSARERFDEYEAQIREEYASVPAAAFRAGRLAVLREFVARPTIFNTRRFIETLEAAARVNLERSIARLDT
jgi:predicted metal-dependent HD superfamily phosphohydrolase